MKLYIIINSTGPKGPRFHKALGLQRRPLRGEELCESGGGRPGLPVRNSPYGLYGLKATLNSGVSELRSCVKMELAVLGSPSLIVHNVISKDV